MHRLPYKRIFSHVSLVGLTIGTTGLFYHVEAYRPAILHLFFLPVILAGLYQGRSRAALVASMAVVLVCAVASNATPGATAATAPGVSVPALMIWAVTIGLVGLAVGHLSDRRRRRIRQLSKSQRTSMLTDPLTGVANRRVFQYELARRLNQWSRRRTPIALVLLDIDNFKKFNDTYGHQVGDVVLRGVARVVQSVVREVDLVARYGGEEFAIVLPGVDLSDATEAAERIRHAVQSTALDCGRLSFRLTVSVGLARALTGEDAESLVRRADGALYSSKQAGRNCAHWHNGSSCEHFGASLLNRTASSDELGEGGLTETDVYTDRWTGLPSRKVFHEELRRRVSESRRYKTRMSVLFVEVDDFDRIKSLGAQAAKMVTATVAEFLKAALRDSDMVARYAENQLGVMLPTTPLGRARIPAERIRQRVDACTSVVCHGTLLSFSVSIGLAELEPEEDASGLLKRVQTAVQAVVSDGGNGLHTHTGDAHAERLTVSLV